MKRIADHVALIGATEGLKGCALVDVDSGMVWFSAGQLEGIDKLGEAGVEYWRVHLRLKNSFEQLGDLNSAMFAFREGILALFPCSDHPSLVLVALAPVAGMNWLTWGTHVRELKRLIAQLNS
jgi:hypothetical protein